MGPASSSGVGGQPEASTRLCSPPSPPLAGGLDGAKACPPPPARAPGRDPREEDPVRRPPRPGRNVIRGTSRPPGSTPIARLTPGTDPAGRPSLSPSPVGLEGRPGEGEGSGRREGPSPGAPAAPWEGGRGPEGVRDTHGRADRHPAMATLTRAWARYLITSRWQVPTNRPAFPDARVSCPQSVRLPRHRPGAPGGPGWGSPEGRVRRGTRH